MEHMLRDVLRCSQCSDMMHSAGEHGATLISQSIVLCRVLRRVMHEMMPGSQVIWYAPSLLCRLIAP